MGFAEKLTQGQKNRYKRWPHLEVLGKTLAKARLGIGPQRIIVCMPPRHGKSETTSKWFPVWCLDQDPTCRVVVASYEASFASTWGDKARRLVDEHAESLNVSRPARGSAEFWETNQGGSMVTAGVGGPITGKGADVLLIDDPVKNAEEANSLTYREKTWSWFQSTAYTRLEPGAVVVIIMTRWHHDDLAGRIIKQMEEQKQLALEIVQENKRRVERGEEPEPVPDVEEWTIIKMKAIAEENGDPDPLGRKPGEALCPERYNEKALKRIERVVGPWVWRSLYQQEPTADEGEIFTRASFRYWTPTRGTHGEVLSYDCTFADGRTRSYPREKCRHVQTVDPAISEKTTADFFVIATWAVTPDANIILVDRIKERIPGPKQVATIRAQWQRYNVLTIGLESVAFQASLFQDAKSKGLPVIPLFPDKDKIARAQVAATRMLVEAIFFPLEAPWLADWEQELLQFPLGHDDQVDTLSYVAIGVADGTLLKGFQGKLGGLEEDDLDRASPWDGDSRIQQDDDQLSLGSSPFKPDPPRKRARGLDI